ncbi:cleavage stimulation factor subunit 2 tau variant isoform X2 [Erinaceus europaeus]|uniref:Cleavage stimulation factor subunit 2 tau variant isoform X2 n=1 Tax=Erinaceus europaeus TaxID=9365 RepID=A0ABM3X746_ERIEU|nr:cleavage stimulation factor subunit 2 tau variant isoform X2 [Erinaceus europaeus]
MSSLSVRDPAMDRSLRSVFVGNIPYEATEEQLKDIFSEVGSVVSFRLVYDRETGKPKGYGFCEYQDQETALSAMRNLNGREFSGRALRVDNAASEKNKEELKSLGPAAPLLDSPYGDPIAPEDAPESISRAVASLPPEQMLELVKQMKLCVQNSRQEARGMLLQNPQLAYALLQAQVAMRLMEPELAARILHRPRPAPPLLLPPPPPLPAKAAPGPGPAPPAAPQPPPPQPPPQPPQPPPPPPPPQHLARRPGKDIPPLMQTPLQPGMPGAAVGLPGPGPMADPRAALPPRGPLAPGGLPPRGLLGDAPNDPRGGTLLSVTGEAEPPPPPPPRGYLGAGPLADPRMLMAAEPRGPMLDPRGLPLDGRAGGGGGGGGGGRDRDRDGRGLEPRVLEADVLERRSLDACAMELRGPGPAARGPMAGGIQGPRPVPNIAGVGAPGAGMQAVAMQGGGMQGAGMPGAGMQGAGMPGPGMQGAGMQGAGMPGAGMQGAGMQGPGMQGAGMQGPGMQGAGMQGAGKAGGGQPSSFSPGQSQVTPQDQEKAALIMQVLQLTADQIAMLPPEQRQSILILKEQIQKSAGAS